MIPSNHHHLIDTSQGRRRIIHSPTSLLGCTVLALFRCRHANSVIDSRALIVEDQVCVAVAYRSACVPCGEYGKDVLAATSFKIRTVPTRISFQCDVLRPGRKFLDVMDRGRWKEIMEEVSGPSLVQVVGQVVARHRSPRYRFALCSYQLMLCVYLDR